MPLIALPTEMLVQIAHFLHPYSGLQSHSRLPSDLNHFTCTNRRLYITLTPYLYSTVDSQDILKWAVENNQTKTITLALASGADLNTMFCSLGPISLDNVGYGCTATERACTLYCESQQEYRRNGSPSDALALVQQRHDLLIFVLNAGGTPTINALITAILTDALDIIRLFAEHGMNLDQSHSYCWTPLTYAGCHGKLDAMRLLLELGADVNCEGYPVKMHRPPLWTCAIEGNAEPEVLEVLLEAGANVDYEDTYRRSMGKALIHRRMFSGKAKTREQIEMLKRYGAWDAHE